MFKLPYALESFFVHLYKNMLDVLCYHKYVYYPKIRLVVLYCLACKSYATRRVTAKRVDC